MKRTLFFFMSEYDKSKIAGKRQIAKKCFAAFNWNNRFHYGMRRDDIHIILLFKIKREKNEKYIERKKNDETNSNKYNNNSELGTYTDIDYLLPLMR